MISSQFHPLQQLNCAEIADLFNRCFEDYLVPVHVDAGFVANRFRRDGVDFGRSFFVQIREERAAMALIAPRFRAARLAGMGVVKAFRGEGVGRATVMEFVRRLRDEGFAEAILEVIEQNEKAVKLYRSAGFEVTQRLLGFERDPLDIDGPDLQEVDTSEYIAALREEADGLPWLHSPDAAATITLPTRCYTVDGSAFGVIAKPAGPGPLIPGGFFVRPDARSRGKGRELLRGLQRLSPDSRWMLPQIFPETVAGFLEHLGFQRLKLTQFEMRMPL